MLLSSVVFVLREVLEAALLISLLLALSKWLGHSGKWILVAMFIGPLGAAIYGFNIDLVSEWFDGVGQEVTNAFLQILVYLLLCAVTLLAASPEQRNPPKSALLAAVMAGSVTLAAVREGSEIMIYLSGFLHVRDLLVPVLAGSVIGAGIGVSVGVVFYYALLNLSRRAAAVSGGLLLALVAAGVAGQVAQLLMQADWLPAQYPLWDSSWLLTEQSVMGQILYALIGYEATPTALQVTMYLSAFFVVIALGLFASRRPAGLSGA